MSRETTLVTADWVEEHLNDPKVVLIEVDDQDEGLELPVELADTRLPDTAVVYSAAEFVGYVAAVADDTARLNTAIGNILAGRELVPECLQDDCTPERLSGELLRWLRDPQGFAAIRR